MGLGHIVYGDVWQSPPHVRLLNQRLIEAATEGNRRLMVAMPPRHGKSMLCSEMLPAWYLGEFPDKRVILTSYEADYAAQYGRKVKNTLDEYGSLFGVTLAQDSKAANRWNIEGRRGGMQTAGIGGAITGKGADFLLVDDPVKNSEEANSFTIRERNWQWWLSTAYTRLEPNASIVVIQTRWHEDDLAGRILRESKEHWDVIDFPAVAVEHDALGRNPGEALWPERYDAKRLQEVRNELGDYWFESLYQQRPKRADGDKIKAAWLRYYERNGTHYIIAQPEGNYRVVEAHDCERFTIVDCAGSSDDAKKEKAGKAASYSAISTFDYCRKRGELYWYDCRRGRWGFTELVEQIRKAFIEHGSAWLGIEDEKTGRAALSMLRQYPTRALSHEGKDKLTRASTALVLMEQGKLFMPESAPWKQFVLDELLSWDGLPDTPYDCGDTLSYAAKHAYRGNQGPIKFPGIVGRI